MNQNLYAILHDLFPADAGTCCIESIDGRTNVLFLEGAEAVILYLACLRSGAVFLPLNTAYTASEVAYFMQDAEPALCVCRPKDARQFEKLAQALDRSRVESLSDDGRGSLMEHFASSPASDFIARNEADDLAAILYTSGTTGRSKGAMLSHGNLSSNALVLHEQWGFVESDVLIHALPIFHVHGLFVALHCSLLNGTPMLFHPRFDAAAVIAGSAPLLPETFAEFESRTGHRILERYGMTEAGMITSNPLDGERIPGTVGFFLPGVSGRVADEQGREVPRGVPGVLEIRGPNVFRGYWRMPEKTAEEFRPDGYFITGDIATMDESGRVSIVGRAKDLIITGGYNVYPKEIELLIDALPGVKESAVIGVPHPDFGEGVVAVVTRDGSADIDQSAVMMALSSSLARFKQPKKVFFIDELPRNAMGKVQKNALRQEFDQVFAVDG